MNIGKKYEAKKEISEITIHGESPCFGLDYIWIQPGCADFDCDCW
jgi:hypothetical protein